MMIKLYTDGSCLGNPGKGGYAAILLKGDSEKVISGGYRNTTNNRMELKAIIEGLKAIKRKSEVIVKTDSNLICDTFNKGWIFNWVKSNWKKGKKKEPVKNVDLLQELLELYNKHNVKFEWVKAHAGNHYNEECDKIAKEEAEKATLIDQNYENNNTNLNFENSLFPSANKSSLISSEDNIYPAISQISIKEINGKIIIDNSSSSLEIRIDQIPELISKLKEVE